MIKLPLDHIGAIKLLIPVIYLEYFVSFIGSADANLEA